MGANVRAINLLTWVVCIAGGLYVYKFYPNGRAETSQIGTPAMHAQPAAQAPRLQQQAAIPPVLYKCQPRSGQTIYSETPCPEPATATVMPQAAPKQPTAMDRKIEFDMSQAERDAAAAAARKRADEELARQWDQRMAQRDRDLANEQASLTAQANAAGAACAGLRQEKEGIVATLRAGGTAQWMNYWTQRLHVVTDAMFRNHC